MTRPIAFDVLEDGAMVAVHPKIAGQIYKPGTRVVLVPYLQRSAASHSHYFAIIHDAWLNLPDALASRWPSEDHLRRFALIRAGFCTQREIVCATRAEALRWATEMSRASEFAVVEATGPVVTIYEAKSQSMRAMGKATFDESKAKVMDVLAELIGTDPTTLRTQAARAA